MREKERESMCVCVNEEENEREIERERARERERGISLVTSKMILLYKERFTLSFRKNETRYW